MADETTRTGKEPVFDPDRAWARFERQAAREPVPAFWRQAEEQRRSDRRQVPSQAMEHQTHTKDEVIPMKQNETTGAPVPAKTPVPSVSWRTETPGKRRLRRLAVLAAAAAMGAGLFTTSLGDRALAAMMQTFRVQHVVGVGLSADDLKGISGLLERGSPEGDREFNLAQYGTLAQSGGGNSRTVTWAEAEKIMGTSLLRLGSAGDPVHQPGTELTFRLNVKAVNQLLSRFGSGTALPAAADGKAIGLHIPDGVAAEGTLAGKPARLLQFGKPELTVEPGIDTAAVRDAVLGLPVLPDSLRTKLAAIGDWQSTLPVPTREGVATNLRIGSHDAVLTVDGTRRLLLWVDGSRIGLLSAETKDFPSETAFTQAAAELIQP